MAEPAASRPRPETLTNGTDSSDGRLGELRRLLVGSELAQIARLQSWVDDTDLRAQDLGHLLQTAKIRQNLTALLKSILARNRDLLVDAVSPIVSEIAVKFVTDAIRDFTDSLNEIAEKSVSARALAWRFEAFRTRRDFADIVLSRSRLYAVREVYLIHAKTGVLLEHVAKQAVAKDADMFSSMLTAMQDFGRDSFVGNEKNELENVDFGSFKLWIRHGQRAVLVGAITGKPPSAVKSRFRATLDEIEKDMAPELNVFSGDVAPFQRARPILERCLLGESDPNPKRKYLLPALLGFVLVAAWVAWAAYSYGNRQRWNNYVQKLNATPGIVLTGVDRQGGGYLVKGLRDQLAPDPAALLQGSGIPASKVMFQLAPYQSLDPRLVAVRTMLSERSAIEQYVVRFSQGKWDISDEDLDGIDEIAGHTRSLIAAAGTLNRSVQIELTGHADELGPEDVNVQLSQDRAGQVAAALVAGGVDAKLLTTRGAATSEPVRTGTSERDRSFNRSVSFRVKTSP
jgi:outer membrane protein OmpA-like peptidoglycan-associated protein